MHQELSIRNAEQKDAVEIHKILNDCATWLSKQGMNHWIGFHTKEWVENAICTQNVRIAKHNKVIVGLIMFREGTKQEIQEVDFAQSIKKSDIQLQKYLWISKLAVSPTCHTLGIGTLLLKDTEALGFDLSFKTFRLEIVKSCKALRDFYEKRDYSLLGEHGDCLVYEKSSI